MKRRTGNSVSPLMDYVLSLSYLSMPTITPRRRSR